MNQAIFLSHASQDADAARRICDELGAAGLEVWFDQNELRGGDAWDASIRKQIKECALFVPIISSNTEKRLEGYFRLEWRLADQRTHLMAGAMRVRHHLIAFKGAHELGAVVEAGFASQSRRSSLRSLRRLGAAGLGCQPPAAAMRLVSLLAG